MVLEMRQVVISAMGGSSPMSKLHLVAFILTAGVFCLPGTSIGQDACDEVQDTASAIISPDEYAWRLFISLNQPADLATKCADTSKSFGAEGSVVWETWRNVQRTVPDTIFKADGTDPGPWLTGAAPFIRQESDFVEIPLKQLASVTQLALDQEDASVASPLFDARVGEGNEVRMNRAAYEFVRAGELYDRNTMDEMAAAGVANLVFPLEAKEIKAQWRKIKEADMPRYHWAIVDGNDGQRQVWGLTALHIITKDLPNWYWATFEHIDNKDTGVWETVSVDSFACPAPPHDCEDIPSGIGLEGTKWENYRLRGSQVDFVTTIGRPTILANSQIEASFQTRSSCITCHAMAAIDADNTALGFAAEVGVPQPGWFMDPATGQRRFMQLDFVFSLLRARPAAAE